MITTLALDLEGTLVSNAMSQIPRPGLHRFLDDCHTLFARVVIFTAISEARLRAIAQLLAAESYAPPWFADIEYVQWTGATKDLAFVRGATPQQVLLVDDLREYIHPGQEAQWIAIEPFVAPYPQTDRGLRVAMEQIRARLPRA